MRKKTLFHFSDYTYYKNEVTKRKQLHKEVRDR